jgi:hypothetical protein
MGDVLFIAIVVAFFALMAGLVALCDRIIGRDEDSDLAILADDATADEGVAA